MRPKEMTCAAIHDLSGLGKCSLTLILPVLSVCGVETSVLPTAVLSTHTGGFGSPVIRDMTEDLLPMARHWKREGCRFSALYSGFLGSAAQIGMVEEIFSMFREPGGLVLVDPVLGDGGKLYSACTEEMAAGMGRLCKGADLITPNMTEACRLLGLPYNPGPYGREELGDILGKLCGLGPRMAVLTGISLTGADVGAACLDSKTGQAGFCTVPRVEGSFHGTGDLFAAVLLGGLLNGMELEGACVLAVEFTRRVAESTRLAGGDPRMGPKFEGQLLWLASRFRK